MTLPDTITWLKDFWFNRSDKTKWIIVIIIGLVLWII
jgi:hypothetical protein